MSTPPPPLPPPTSSTPLNPTPTRFELELALVQSLSNPSYLTHLASQKYLQEPSFIAYLNYLLYWTKPEYTKFLMYPGPTLRVLELLQVERFRSEVLSPDVGGGLGEGWIRGSVEGR